MRFLLVVLLWCLLFAVAWPLALLVLVLLPFVWLLSLPFRLLGAVVEAMFAFVKRSIAPPSIGSDASSDGRW